MVPFSDLVPLCYVLSRADIEAPRVQCEGSSSRNRSIKLNFILHATSQGTRCKHSGWACVTTG